MIFTVAIPEDLMKEGRTFYVIRVHDGKAEKLETVENEDGTLTFKTDKFSTYALAYEDAQESTTTPTTPNQPNNPEQPTQPGQSQDDIKGEAVVTPDNNQQVTNTQNTQETAQRTKNWGHFKYCTLWSNGINQFRTCWSNCTKKESF